MSIDSIVAETAKVNRTIIEQDVRVWRDAFVDESVLHQKVSIGDFSIIRHSSLDRGVEIGRRNTIDHVSIGNGTYTGEFCVIKHCTIGKYCSISWNVSIGGANHDMNHLSTAPVYRILQRSPDNLYRSFRNEQLIIGNDVWIGAGAHITRGVTIGNGAVIAANAVVTKDIPPYHIYAGVPAKKIGQRFSDDIIDSLEQIKWWDMPLEKLKEAEIYFSQDLNTETLTRIKEIWRDV